jgi:predicted nucleotidyltransferase
MTSYLPQIKKVVRGFDPEGENRYFVFGSAARSQKFHDIDLGVKGNRLAKKPLERLRDLFYDAPIPYKVDVVDIDAVDADFREHIENNETKIWI